MRANNPTFCMPIISMVTVSTFSRRSVTRILKGIVAKHRASPYMRFAKRTKIKNSAYTKQKAEVSYLRGIHSTSHGEYPTTDSIFDGYVHISFASQIKPQVYRELRANWSHQGTDPPQMAPQLK